MFFALSGISHPVPTYILGGLLIVLAIALVVMILKQSGKDTSVSSTITGASSDTYFGKTKGDTTDRVLSKLTVVFTAVFVVVAIALVVLQYLG